MVYSTSATKLGDGSGPAGELPSQEPRKPRTCGASGLKKRFPSKCFGNGGAPPASGESVLASFTEFPEYRIRIHRQSVLKTGCRWVTDAGYDSWPLVIACSLRSSNVRAPGPTFCPGQGLLSVDISGEEGLSMWIRKFRTRAEGASVLAGLSAWSLVLVCCGGVCLIEAAPRVPRRFAGRGRQPENGGNGGERKAAGSAAIPPITDRQFGFAWPDSEFGVFRTDAGYTFFSSDGAHHNENNKYGSVTRTLGTLDNPVGTAPPIDVIVHPNPDPAVNPNYAAYTYMGSGRIYRVLDGKPGAGSLLDVYHAEINTETSFYSLLGLAISKDDGLHWTDLGEIVRPNQPYEADLAGFDIGSPRLVDSPDGQYFYVYFPDWIANGTPSQLPRRSSR